MKLFDSIIDFVIAAAMVAIAVIAIQRVAHCADLHYCVVKNVGRNEPLAVRKVEYLHVKASADGNTTLIITLASCKSIGATETSKAAMQGMLIQWAQAEQGEAIQLDAHLAKSQLRPVLLEEIKAAKLERGFCNAQERAELKDVVTLVRAYPLMTKKLSPMELEDLLRALKRNVR